MIAVSAGRFALIFIAVFHNQTNRTLAQFGEYGFEVVFCFCSITGNSPNVLPSGKAGAVQGANLLIPDDWGPDRLTD